MDWRDIPSLTALRGFEAAVRLGSLSAAARELNVTHAAVAQNVRVLEEHFGRPLLQREGRGMTPTPDGSVLAEGLAEGFGAIAGTVRLMSRDETRPVRVALTPSFAENWLMPVIGQFWDTHPGIRLELLPSHKLVDLRAENIDVAVRYGDGSWRGTEPEPLLSVVHVAVGAPSLIGTNPSSDLNDYLNFHWLFASYRQEEQVWAEQQGLDLSRARITEFETYAMLLQAVRAGAGVSIVPEIFVSDDVKSGRLLSFVRGPSDYTYHIVRGPGGHRTAVETFVRWLRQTASD